MATYILPLRGVMPTGKNKVPMAALRTALEAAGLNGVRTYIQSGNVIASTTLSRSALEARVHDLIAAEFGGDIPVMARTPDELRNVLTGNPFAAHDPARQYITLFQTAPAPDLVTGAPVEAACHHPRSQYHRQAAGAGTHRLCWLDWPLALVFIASAAIKT